jgi:hypothetical protein
MDKLSRDITNIIKKYNLISEQNVIWNRKECLSDLRMYTYGIRYELDYSKNRKLKLRKIVNRVIDSKGNESMVWNIIN